MICASLPQKWLTQTPIISSLYPTLLPSLLSHTLVYYPSHPHTRPAPPDGSDDALHDGAYNSMGFFFKAFEHRQVQGLSKRLCANSCRLPVPGFSIYAISGMRTWTGTLTIMVLSPQRTHPCPPITSALAPRMFPVIRNHLRLPPSS